MRFGALSGAILLAAGAAGSDLPAVLVFTGSDYARTLAEGPAKDVVEVVPCGSPGSCTALDPAVKQRVVAVVGQPRNVSFLQELPKLKLMQSADFFYPSFDLVPASSAVAMYLVDYQGDYGAEPIAEFIIASAFEWNYRLREKSATFSSCAWGADAPLRCPPAESLTSHPVLMGQTMGILGYGTIGEAVARRSSAMGMRTIATRRKGPFTPTPPGLTWFSDDNDQLLREADFVAVTLSGSASDVINKTSLALMKPGAVVIPIAGPPVDYDALYEALSKKAIGGAVLDSWRHGCWSYPVAACGPAYGPDAEPYAKDPIQLLDNVIPLPGMAMRDAKFWEDSAVFVGKNLLALVNNQPLQGVLRNGTSSRGPAITELVV